MNYKMKQFDVKSISDTGELTGYFSTYQTVADCYGDCIAPGCFAGTIKAWNEKGKHIPLVWNHNMEDPEMIIGQVDKIEDDEYGPLMTAHFYDTPKAQAVRNLMREGSVYQFSYAYDVNASRNPNENEKASDPRITQVLESVSLLEITVTPTPAQPLAEAVSVKSEDQVVKSGRRNSAKDEDKLRQAIALLQEVLGELDDTPDEPVETEAKSEEPSAVNDEEQMRKQALIAEATKLLNKEA